MADLTEQNIREIEVLVEARGVEMQELSYDLVDHICCMIEGKMESGKNYASALEESIASFGKEGIRQIQEETTFLLTKNILAMRKTMHITGITAAILLMLGSIFEVLHWPGAAIIYVIGGASLCLIFMPLFLAVRIKEKPGKISTISNVIGAIGSIALCLGILFKIMHWPWAAILMTVGGGLLMFIFLPLYVYNNIKTKQLKTSTIVPIIVAIAGFSLLFSLVKHRNSNDVLTAAHNIQYNLDNESAELKTLNNSLLQTIDSKKLEQNEQTTLEHNINKTADLLSYIDNLMITSIWSLNEKGMTREDAKATLTRNYAGLGNSHINLNHLRGNKAKKESLEELLSKVTAYEKDLKEVIGNSVSLTYNKPNFTAYITRKNQHFLMGIVLQDLITLKVQIQKSQTLLLTYYKGKVS